MVNTINHKLIEYYLNELYKNLQLLPKIERDLQVSEVRDHLFHKVQNKTKAGIGINEAVESTLQEFLPPEELAKRIINVEDDDKSMFNKGESMFKLGMMMTVGSFGGLSIPVLNGALDLGIITPFLISLIVGIILLNSNSIQWNEIQLKNLKWITRILIGFLSVPCTFFAYRIIVDSSINYLILAYLGILLMAAFMVVLFFNSLYKNKQVHNY